MSDDFAFGMILMHMLYGFLFFAIGCAKNKRPSFWISTIAILLWPLMVQHLMDRSSQQNKKAQP